MNTSLESMEDEIACKTDCYSASNFNQLCQDFDNLNEKYLALKKACDEAWLKVARIAKASTSPPNTADYLAIRAENEALKEQAAHLNAGNADIAAELEKEQMLNTSLQSKSAALVDALEQWKVSTQFHQVMFAEERLITNEALAAFKEQS